MKYAIVALAALLTAAPNPLAAGEELVPLLDRFPAAPASWQLIDWQQRAVRFTEFVFDEHPEGIGPVGVWRHNRGNDEFIVSSYVNSAGGGEAVCTLASVLTGSLAGLDMAHYNGRDWFATCNAWFSEDAGVVFNSLGSKNDARSFWYAILPGILYTQIALAHPEVSYLQTNVRRMADRYASVVDALGGANANFNHTGFDFITNSPVDNGRWVEPDAAAGIAYIEYAAWLRWREPRHLLAARWCLDFLERRKLEDGNPLYEALLYYAPVVAARINLEEGAHYDVAKLMNWCFSENSGPNSSRPKWGIIARDFCGTPAFGLQGSTAQNAGYGFAMNTFNAAAAIAPLAKYAPSYAPEVAKWLAHVANNARFFFPDEISEDSQSCPDLRRTQACSVPYEGLREKIIRHLDWTIISPEPKTSLPAAGNQGDGIVVLSRSAGIREAVFKTVLPAAVTGGDWWIQARLAPGQSFNVQVSGTDSGPWRSVGHISRAFEQPSGDISARGGLELQREMKELWIRIAADSDPRSDEKLVIKSLRLKANVDNGPWASGDSYTEGSGASDLAVYGGAYVGYLGALVHDTGLEQVVAFNLSATDFLAPNSKPVWLCYNGGNEVKTVTLPGGDAVTVQPKMGVLAKSRD